MRNSDIELFQLADAVQKRLGLRYLAATLGNPVDVPGLPGYVNVVYTIAGANTFSAPNQLPLRSSNVSKTPGAAVRVEYDTDGTLCVKDVDYVGLLAQGTNPSINNAADDNVTYWIAQQRLVTLASHPVSSAANSMLVTVQPWLGIDLSTDTTSYFQGGQIDLTASIPGGAGEWRLACLFLKTDMTIEVVTSTAKTSPTDLGFDDIDECLAGRTAGSLPVWAWQLYNGQTGIAAGAPVEGGDDFMDLRQLVNSALGSGGGGAPVGATYLVQTADGTLTNEQAMGALATGLVKNTTTTGVQSIAAAGTDYNSPTASNITNYQDYTEASTPSTPASDHLRVFAADDNGVTVMQYVDSNGAVIEIERDIIAVAKNTSGGTLSPLAACRFTTGSGNLNMTKSAYNGDEGQLVDGIVMDTVANNAFGRIMIQGILTGVDTSGFIAGATLLLGTTNGVLTATVPTAGMGFAQIVAKVITSSVSGIVYVLPRKITQLDRVFYNTLNIGTGSTANLDFYGTSTFHGSLKYAVLTADVITTIPAVTDTLVGKTTTDAFTNKVFTDGTTVNDSAGATGDFTVKGDTDNATLVVDVSADATGFGTATPNASAKLHVVSTTKGSVPRPVQTAAQTAAISSPIEGLRAENSDTQHEVYYDGQRFRNLSVNGWVPYALPMIFDPGAPLTTAHFLAANGGSIAVPMRVYGHMLLQSVSIRNTDTSLARLWGWDLYEQYLNNGNSGENTLTRVANSTADESYTATAASTRTIAAASAPVYLAPGVYWLVIQNRHATNNYGLGSTAVGSAFAVSSAQTKTTSNPNGATLDFVAATWTKVTANYGVRLDGRVLGETTAF